MVLRRRKFNETEVVDHKTVREEIVGVYTQCAELEESARANNRVGWKGKANAAAVDASVST
jgi:hypothetical protein